MVQWKVKTKTAGGDTHTEGDTQWLLQTRVYILCTTDPVTDGQQPIGGSVQICYSSKSTDTTV